MFTYRLTKYDPAYRDDTGAFVHDDWISVSQIGRSFGGEALTKDKYLEYEDKYIEAVRQLSSFSKIHSMRINDLEFKPDFTDDLFGDGLPERCASLRADTIAVGDDLESVVRGNLREIIWCRLQGPQESYIHFGYDYYMYIGLSRNASTAILPKGMFLEKFESPYTSLHD